MGHKPINLSRFTVTVFILWGFFLWKLVEISYSDRTFLPVSKLTLLMAGVCSISSQVNEDLQLKYLFSLSSLDSTVTGKKLLFLTICFARLSKKNISHLTRFYFSWTIPFCFENAGLELYTLFSQFCVVALIPLNFFLKSHIP